VTDRITIIKGITHTPEENISYEKKRKKTRDSLLRGDYWEKSKCESKSPTLYRKDKVKHYIRIKAHNNIALKFWCKSGV